ncbi:MAG: polysaccharide deacetylase family protein [Eubacteriales bacterium]|nr:polysaccharide deacetylase family protein [Eubacteriales bacterium]
MWKKDRYILLLIIILLLLVLLFAWGAGRLRLSAVFGKKLFEEQFRAAAVLSEATAPKQEKESAEKPVKEGEEKEDKGKVALTFDDGPHPVYTLQLLNGLAERKVKATFFITGKNAENYPDLVLRMYEEGHLIGNHTYSHLQLNNRNREKFKAELVQTNEIIKEITGEEVVFVRPPYGSWDKKFEEELNMFPVLWTIDPLDWCSDDVSCVVNKVIPKIKENSIILMHDEYASTVTAALRIVDELQEEGYTFVTVDEILFD